VFLTVSLLNGSVPLPFPLQISSNKSPKKSFGRKREETFHGGCYLLQSKVNTSKKSEGTQFSKNKGRNELKKSVGIEEWPVVIVTALFIMLKATELRNYIGFDGDTLRKTGSYMWQFCEIGIHLIASKLKYE
jgi:hypothetical protein